VVLSGGQAFSGHNVIARIFNYLQQHAFDNNILYGFKGSQILKIFNILKGQIFYNQKMKCQMGVLKIK